MIAMIDGFDTQVIGIAAPAIASDLSLETATFGAIFAIGLTGGLIGAVLAGPASDRGSRRVVLLICLGVMSVGSLATPFVSNAVELSAARFFTGLGLGGAVPVIIALTTESVPPRARVRIVGLMFTGFPLGGLLGGLTAAVVIPAFGWRSLFILGGVVPLLLTVAVWLVISGKAPSRPEPTATGSPPRGSRPAVFQLLTRQNRAGTLLIWATFIFSLLVTYLLTSWIPLLVVRSGMAPITAILASVALNLGCIVGVLTLGAFGARRSVARALVVGYAGGGVFIAAIGAFGGAPVGLLAATFLSGAFTIAAQMLANGVCAVFYGRDLRATGVGYAVGMGRIGSIAGPALAGILVAADAATWQIFAVAGAISLLAALFAAGLAAVFSRMR
ncbi:MFS transporter [Herbiconiux sp. CPCC 205763]|uniref:MFS transporter n=1 Tax=Herbiconiux aconitum TaxID=2970913 RepID=A0ABT2GSD5_9MICO|nr:MFS transporter [Herbiconiux aconitum]MCS5717721.1 MFS transporter [Herbiconiux aconitum]